MKAVPLLFPFLVCLTLCPGLRAQNEAFTDPVGFNTVECLPNSDTFCGVPFVQNAAFQGVLSSNPIVDAGNAVLTPSGTPNWSANQFQTAYFVRILTGAKAGSYYQVVDNGTASLTVNLAGDTTNGLTEGDSFRIYKFWTLATLFPPATQTTIVPSLGTLANQRRTELMMPDLFSAGTNLAPTAKFYIANGQWRKAVSGNPVADNEMLWPDTYFIIRHNHPTITVSTVFTPVGLVELNPVTTPLSSRTAGQQDNFVVTGRPVPVKLKDLDLVTSGAFTPSLGTLANQRRDELLVFDNSVAEVNKAPSIKYYYVGSNWRKAVSGNPIADDDELLPSHGLIIRKYQTAGGDTSFWTHTY